LLFRTWAIISTVEVFPLEPVTAIEVSGISRHDNISGQILRAYLPGRLEPRPKRPAIDLITLHTRIAVNMRNFFIEKHYIKTFNFIPHNRSDSPQPFFTGKEFRQIFIKLVKNRFTFPI